MHVPGVYIHDQNSVASSALGREDDCGRVKKHAPSKDPNRKMYIEDIMKLKG